MAFPVELKDFCHMTLSHTGVLKKVGVSTTWNASASSLHCMHDGSSGVSGISFHPVLGSTFVCGLSSHKVIRDDHFNKLDFAIACYQFGSVEVWEKGNYVCQKQMQASATNVQVKIFYHRDGMVCYFLDDALIWTSVEVPAFPLYVQVSAHSPGAVLSDLCWIGDSPEKVKDPRKLQTSLSKTSLSPELVAKSSSKSTNTKSDKAVDFGVNSGTSTPTRQISPQSGSTIRQISPQSGSVTRQISPQSVPEASVEETLESSERDQIRETQEAGKSNDKLHPGTICAFTFIFLVLSGCALVAALRTQHASSCVVPANAQYQCSQIAGSVVGEVSFTGSFSGVVYKNGDQSESCSSYEHTAVRSESECKRTRGSEVSCTRDTESGTCRYGLEESEKGSGWLVTGIVCGVCSCLSGIASILLCFRRRRAPLCDETQV